MKKYIRIFLFVLLFAGMTTSVVYAQGEDGILRRRSASPVAAPHRRGDGR